MRIHRRWPSCAILLAVMSVVSCAEGQFGQVMQNVGKSMAKGMCAEGNGPASAAPEFCLYVTELRLLNHDSEADVSLTIVNRTGRRIYLTVPSWPYLTDSSGAKWTMTKNAGIVYSGYGAPLSLEPNVDSQVSFIFQRQGQAPSDLTFSMRGEVSIAKIDSRGEPVPGQPQVTRGFNFSGIRLVQESQQPAQPQQGNVPAPQNAQQSAASPVVQQSASSVASRNEVPTARAVPSPMAAPSVSGATSVPGSLTWDKLDIVGLKIGISPDEYRQRLMRNDLPLEIQTFEAELIDVPNTKYTSHIVGVSKKLDPSAGVLEILSASFAPVPSKPVAGVIGRMRSYPEAQQPTMQNVQEALIEKYGPPSYKRNVENMGFESWAWVFDRNGKQIASPGLSEECRMIESLSLKVEKPTTSFFDEDSIRWFVGCGRVLHVRTSQHPVKRDNLAWRVTSVLLDPFVIEESLAKTGAMVSAYKKKQQEEELQRAQRQGKPKL